MYGGLIMRLVRDNIIKVTDDTVKIDRLKAEGFEPIEDAEKLAEEDKKEIEAVNKEVEAVNKEAEAVEVAEVAEEAEKAEAKKTKKTTSNKK